MKEQVTLSGNRFADSKSDTYDSFPWPNYDRAQDRMKNILKKHYLNTFRNDEAVRIIELGSGTGLTTKRILDTNKNFSVTAVEKEARMVRQAQRNLTNYIKDGRLEIVHEDALDYLRKGTSNSIKIIATASTLHNIESRKRHIILEHIYRTLSPRGLFLDEDKIGYDSAKDHNRHLAAELDELCRNIPNPNYRKLWLEHYLEDEAPELAIKWNKFKKELSTIGFRNIQTRYREHLTQVITCIKPQK